MFRVDISAPPTTDGTDGLGSLEADLMEESEREALSLGRSGVTPSGAVVEGGEDGDRIN